MQFKFGGAKEGVYIGHPLHRTHALGCMADHNSDTHCINFFDPKAQIHKSNLSPNLIHLLPKLFQSMAKRSQKANGGGTSTKATGEGQPLIFPTEKMIKWNLTT